MNSILTVIGALFNAISYVKVENSYTKPGYIADDYLLIKSTTPLNYKEAIAYCGTTNLDIFDPTSGMELLKVMYDMKTKQVWTSLYEHKVTEVLVTMYEKTPVTQTKDTVIGLVTGKVPDTHMVALTLKDDNTTTYEAIIASEKLTTLCMTPVAYPQRTNDRLTFSKAKERALENISEMKRRAEKIKRRIRNKMLAIPKLGTVKELKEDMKKRNYTLNVTDAWDREFDLEQRILNNLEVHITSLAKEWTTISGPDDLTLLLQHHAQWEQSFYNILAEIQEPLFYPESMIEAEDRDRVDYEYPENRNPPMGISENPGKMLFFVHFKEKGTDDLLPFLRLEKPLGKYYDPDWEHFDRISFWDLLFIIILLFNTMFCMFVGINECIHKRDSWLVWKGWFLRQPVNHPREFFNVKQVSRRSSITSPMSEQRTAGSMERKRGRDQEQVRFQSKRKRQAPRPPTEHFEMVSPIDDEVYVSPPKPRNRPVYIKVINAHQPVADADSDLD
jgi:hypothetical protein